MKNLLKILLITIGLVVCGGCAEIARYDDAMKSMEKTAIEYVATNSTPRIKELIRQHEIELGMNFCEVIASIGMPLTVNMSEGRYGHHEQWIYPMKHPKYLYLDNYILTSWQN